MERTVITASKIGFCPGVRKAIEATSKAAASGTIFTLGMLVHNDIVVKELEPLGIKAVKSMDGISGTVGITAHGAAPRVYDEIKRRNLNLLDTTCSIVRKAQEKAAQFGKEGYFVLVYGDPDHAEVRGILGWAGANSAATTSASQVAGTLHRRLAIVSQTTRVPIDFQSFVSQAIVPIDKFEEVRVAVTICPHVVKRVNEALRLAASTDLVVVVGDPASANTNRLVEICNRVGRAILVSSAGELGNFEELKSAGKVGVISGTSTPDQVIAEVAEALNRLE